MPGRHSLFRSLPSMNALLDMFTDSTGTITPFATSLPHPLLRKSIESFLAQCRVAIREGRIQNLDELSPHVLFPALARHVERVSRPHFCRVLNATGVVIHTNLGRSLLAEEAVSAVAKVSRHYSNLEFSLANGARGSRYGHVEDLILSLTGAQGALVVNNNAAAVLLTLDTLCKGREVIVSRGELVEIGGSFRIPDVMEKSGCFLKETGTTNRTHLTDYAVAITERTAAIMKVHTSNFRLVGFTCETPRREIATLAQEHSLPLLEDLGSGTLFDFAGAGLPQLGSEPTPAKVLAEGVDVVSFSGDKVLGGPQAGIIAGKAEYIDRIKKNPMNRALRIDKMTLAALEATLRLYLNPDLAKKQIPTLRMICMDEKELVKRARRLAALLRRRIAASGIKGVSVAVHPGFSRIGGGSFPGHDLPTRLVCPTVAFSSPDKLRKALLHTSPPLVARVEVGRLCLDPRTLLDSEFPLLADAFIQAIARLTAQAAATSNNNTFAV